MKFLAFDNTWSIVALVWGLLLVRAVVPRVQQLRQQRGGILEIVDSLLVAVLLVFLILRPFVVQAFFIPSGSMIPSLEINDRILVNKFIYFLREPQRGDIVVFVSPRNADPDQKDFIKRVIGLPGDRLAVRNARLYRNGEPVDEPYIAEFMMYQFPPNLEEYYRDPNQFKFPPGEEYTVPPGYLFVMGDNRNLSNDSHKWGPLPRENVLGKAFCIFWPVPRVRLLR
ncbi:MAG TPA: signal peptidase I [Armatimonadota bacterium]